MNQGIERLIIRWIHIVCSVPIAGYIYGPFHALPSYASVIRFFFFPLIVLSGLWMWRGRVVLRLFSKKST